MACGSLWYEDERYEMYDIVWWLGEMFHALSLQGSVGEGKRRSPSPLSYRGRVESGLLWCRKSSEEVLDENLRGFSRM